MFHAKAYFLGLDVGGSKTHALLADQDGGVVGFGSGGPGNQQGVGYDGLTAVVTQVVQQALQQAGVRIEQVQGAGFGIAGYDWDCQLEEHLDALRPLGLNCPLKIVNDAAIGLAAGARQGWGISLVSGTGNNCRGRDRQGREGRVTGEGGWFGEYGGGGDLVWKAVARISYEWVKRAGPTMLTPLFVEKAGAKDIYDFIEGVDLRRYFPEASWAPIVFQAARAGDQAANQIVVWNATEVAELGCGVIRQLDLQHEALDVVLIGSLFKAGEIYLEPLRRVILQVAPQAHFIPLAVPPVVGSVLLGMELAFGQDAYTRREQLIQSTAQMLQR